MGEYVAMMHEWEMALAHLPALPPSVVEAVRILGL
jgi:hypothetical protein